MPPKVPPQIIIGNLMALDTKEFINVVETGLKANKNFNRFMYAFKSGTIRKRGLIDYTKQNWDKRTRIDNAKNEVRQLKNSTNKEKGEFDHSSSLNTVADIYFDNLTNSKWNQERKGIYNLYCRGDEIKNNKGNVVRKKVRKPILIHPMIIP